MSAPIWKIGPAASSSSAATPCADLGIRDIQLHYAANGPESLTFTISSQNACMDDIAFTPKAWYTLWKDGSRYFTGVMTVPPRTGSAESEEVTITLAGPYWCFEQSTYMQSWMCWYTGTEAVAATNMCRVILFQAAYGVPMLSGAQIADVLNWLIGKGAPLAIGTIATGVTLPTDEQLNMLCSSVVDTVLRWTPDYVLSFDHSTYPVTVNFRQKDSLSAVTVPVGVDMSLLNITARYDLIKPGFTLIYQTTSTNDGKSYTSIVTDTAGDTTKLDSVIGGFDLVGSSQTWTTQKIVTANFPTPNDKTWWKAHVKWLANVADGDLTIHDHALSTGERYDRYLTEGAMQDWMSLASEACTVTAQADVVLRDGDDAVIETVKNVPISFDCIATAATTQTYRTRSSWTSGEVVPTGVAAALYASWSVLHFEGSLKLLEQECSGSLRPGKVVNISGGRSEWASMAAIVKEVNEDLARGETTVTFGPPAALSADTVVALFRALHKRNYAASAASKDTGIVSNGSSTDLSGATPDSSESTGKGEKTRLLVSNSNTDGDHVADLDPENVAFEDSGDAADQTLSIKEVIVPEDDGSGNIVGKRRQVLCSESYHDPVSLGGGGEPHDPTTKDTIGGTTEGSESGESTTKTFGDGKGLSLFVMSRVAYYDAGDKTLYGYTREIRFDENGQLYYVSAETRVTIDVTVAE